MKKLLTLFAAILFSAVAFAQVPNNSFEMWQTKTGFGMTGPYSYQIPQAWELGYISDMLAGVGIPPNVGSSPVSQNGSMALKLSSTLFTFMGTSDTLGADVAGTFGISNRPASLNGYFRTSAAVTNPDNYGHAMVFLTKWTPAGRDTIAFGGADLDSSPLGFTAFSAPIQYMNNLTPDTAIIWFAYFPRAVNVNILVDNVALVGTIAGVKDTPVFNELKFFPNPVTNNATLTFNSPKAENAVLSITDITGKEVKKMALGNLNTGANTVNLPLEELKKGMYFATLQTARGTQTMRFVKQ